MRVIEGLGWELTHQKILRRGKLFKSSFSSMRWDLFLTALWISNALSTLNFMDLVLVCKISNLFKLKV